MKSSRALILILILCGLIVTAIFPFELVMAPERKLQIIDTKGHPITDALIEQFWFQYSLGVHGDIRQKTDAEGVVVFPKRSVRTNIISLLRGALREFESIGIHASYGSDENIFILIDSKLVKSFYGGEKLISEKVIIDKK